MKAAVLMLIVAGAITAQAQLLPQAPEVRPSHKFLDWKNASLLTASAAAISSDSVSTQAFLNYPKLIEVNPLARPFIRTRPGQAFISGIGFAGEIGSMYVAHRRGWHHMERWIPVFTIAAESYLTIHNFRMITEEK
jgi:hypothetical protein